MTSANPLKKNIIILRTFLFTTRFLSIREGISCAKCSWKITTAVDFFFFFPEGSNRKIPAKLIDLVGIEILFFFFLAAVDLYFNL
jgi:hypothetical protein